MKVLGKRRVMYPASYGTDAEMLSDFAAKVAASESIGQVDEIVACFRSISETSYAMGDITLAELVSEMNFYARLADERRSAIDVEAAQYALLDELAQRELDSLVLV